MKYAAVDVGSNTVRLLVASVVNGRISPEIYFRKITRLAGGLSSHHELSPDSMERTLDALAEVAEVVRSEQIKNIRAVATEALRRAGNAAAFISMVKQRSGLSLELIGGCDEAKLCAAGVSMALNPRPECCLIFDIGGGSTEFIVQRHDEILFRASYPLGVVGLSEGGAPVDVCINTILSQLQTDLRMADLISLVFNPECVLVGTAGTVTTLAALDMGMTFYDWKLVNNYILTTTAVHELRERLSSLNHAERELLPGMEKGRGDLILPGASIVLEIMSIFGKDSLRVSDFGLLEGVLVSLFVRDQSSAIPDK